MFMRACVLCRVLSLVKQEAAGASKQRRGSTFRPSLDEQLKPLALTSLWSPKLTATDESASQMQPPLSPTPEITPKPQRSVYSRLGAQQQNATRVMRMKLQFKHCYLDTIVDVDAEAFATGAGDLAMTVLRMRRKSDVSHDLLVADTKGRIEHVTGGMQQGCQVSVFVSSKQVPAESKCP